MAITFIRRAGADNGIRPLKPSRDLRDVAGLIEEAFASELDRTGRAALREMRWLGRWGFLLFWLDVLSPDVNTHLNGFVSVERGQIVGNATVSRSAPGARHWFISNVAVAKLHRGRGTARQLMEAAIEYVKEMRGQSISLYVRQGNAPAIHLYQSMGFKRVSATAFMFIPKPKAVERAPFPPELTLREHNLDVRDSRAAYKLARTAIPARVQMERPLHQSHFSLGSEVAFNNFWRGLVGLGKAKHWVVEDKPGSFVGMLSVEPASWRGEHSLTFLVHPDWWGVLEDPLIRTALAYLKTCPARPISFRHSEEHKAGIQALLALDFSIERTHIWMKLDL
ncbi:MAG: GNAT family N-acetyltransferase [Anaerolineae bacterium]